MIRNGKLEKLPYSLSRWTDLPVAKWDWFLTQVDQGHMVGFDPRTAIPARWSLKSWETFGLIFWTKDPTNLIQHADLVKRYPFVVHMTLTGWTEVEKGAPDIDEGIDLMRRAVSAFGPSRVTWRFSPVPAVPDVIPRFTKIADAAAAAGLPEVYLAFLQENDLMPEKRSSRVRKELMRRMATLAPNLKVLLCNEDRTLNDEPATIRPANLGTGVCESGNRFAQTDYAVDQPKTEGCGCSLAVDPFTINETCSLGCTYCYAADKTLSPKKRNTTKVRLPVVSS